MSGSFDLSRFVEAQDARSRAGTIYDQALAELTAGEKRSHWMWFIFPQLAGLGTSAMAQRYAIASREEAAAYLAHPLLGHRLRACVAALNAVEGRAAREIMGAPDDVKLRSSLTLFAHATQDNADFRRALAKYYADEEDPASLRLLGA